MADLCNTMEPDMNGISDAKQVLVCIAQQMGNV